MTREESEAAIAELQCKIENYAELIVRKGVAIQQGQELVVNGPVERADFVRLVVKKAYQAGAGHVTVLWADSELSRMEYQHMDVEYFRNTPTWKREQLNTLATDGAAFLFIEGTDPYALTGVDPAKPATRARAHSEQCAEYRNGLDFGRNPWCIAGAPVEAWATVVFPHLPTHEALYRLWEAILKVSRADVDDPQAEWDCHNATFKKNKDALNEYAFDQLHYTSSNGTDLTVGMNPQHIWEGGCEVSVNGLVFFPNIPTEEVFTTPDCNRVNGVVHSVLPLVHAGRIVKDFWLRFEDGCVVEYDAAEGKDVLKSIIETDERSCRLGECALIAKNTPIRQSGLLFYSTLYDENASCHLALGKGFPECLEGGMGMSKDELIAHGVNQSHTHVDFMIGSDDLNIVGVTSDGKRIPVFEDGLWAWDGV